MSNIVWGMRLIGGLLVAGGIWWIVDAIGDHREASVWREINAAVEKRNAGLRAENEQADKLLDTMEAERAKAVSEAIANLPRAAPECVLSTSEAEALTRIR